MNAKWVKDYINCQKTILNIIQPDDIFNVIQAIAYAFQNNRQIFVIGNGGSAANASHFVEDLGKGASDAIAKHPLYLGRRFRIIDLTSSVPYITAIGNDISFEAIFTKQLENLAQPGDLLIGISVSGTSPNLVNAFDFANTHQIRTISLVGKQALTKAHSIHARAELSLAIPDTHYGRVEDTQAMILHMICYFFMEALT